MPVTEIKRDAEDTSVIVRYRSKEISVLPLDAAANKLTGFTLLGGRNMNLEPKGTEEGIKSWLGEEKFADLAEALDMKGVEAKEAN